MGTFRLLQQVKRAWFQWQLRLLWDAEPHLTISINIISEVGAVEINQKILLNLISQITTLWKCKWYLQQYKILQDAWMYSSYDIAFNLQQMHTLASRTQGKKVYSWSNPSLTILLFCTGSQQNMLCSSPWNI